MNKMSDEDFIQALRSLVEMNNGVLDVDYTNHIISISCDSHEDEMKLAEMISVFFGKYEYNVG